MIRAGIVLAILTGCVEQFDPEVIVVLPDIPDPCSTLEVTRARVAVDTVDDEHFELASETCGPLATQPVFGFTLAIDRLTYGYHRAVITLESDRELGRIERPFAAEGPMVVVFDYADLPSWPTAPLSLASCPASSIELSITPTLATRPAFAGTITCETVLDVPRGPLSIAARTIDPCMVAETLIPDTSAPLALELVPCP